MNVRFTFGSDVALEFWRVYGYCLQSGDRLPNGTILYSRHLGLHIGGEWALGSELTVDFG